MFYQMDIWIWFLLQGSHFSEQLDVLRQQFRETTDRLISTIETTYDTQLAQEWGQMPNQPSLSNLALKNNVNNNESSPSDNLNRNGLPNVGRRISIFGPSNPADRPSLMGIAERRESGSKSSCSFRSSGMFFWYQIILERSTLFSIQMTKKMWRKSWRKVNRRMKSVKRCEGFPRPLNPVDYRSGKPTTSYRKPNRR